MSNRHAKQDKGSPVIKDANLKGSIVLPLTCRHCDLAWRFASRETAHRVLAGNEQLLV